MKKVTLTEIQYNRPKSALPDSPMFLYAVIKDYETDDIETCATLDYCLQVIKERNWQVCIPKKS